MVRVEKTKTIAKGNIGGRELFSPPFYKNVVRIWKAVTCNQVSASLRLFMLCMLQARAIFGFVGEDSMGKVSFTNETQWLPFLTYIS